MSLLTNIITKGHFHVTSQCNKLQRELLHLLLHLPFLEVVKSDDFQKETFVSLPVFPPF